MGCELPLCLGGTPGEEHSAGMREELPFPVCPVNETVVVTVVKDTITLHSKILASDPRSAVM